MVWLSAPQLIMTFFHTARSTCPAGVDSSCGKLGYVYSMEKNSCAGTARIDPQWLGRAREGYTTTGECNGQPAMSRDAATQRQAWSMTRTVRAGWQAHAATAHGAAASCTGLSSHTRDCQGTTLERALCCSQQAQVGRRS